MIPLKDDQPTERFPFVTLLLIAVNAYVFIGWQLREGLAESVALAGFIPQELTGHVPGGATHLVTAMFMHGGWMHLIGNMWFLWIFGNNIEDNCGPFRFLAFYLLCGAAATLAYTFFSPQSTVPLVGASGAISGVLGAYLMHHPKAKIRTLVPLGIFPLFFNFPAWAFLFVWIGFQILSQFMASLQEGGGDGIAYVAHIGGFIAGLGLIFFFERPNDYRRLHE